MGLGIDLDREYCEIKWKENTEQKYICIDDVNSEKFVDIQEKCLLEFDPEDEFLQDACIEDRNLTANYITKGQDYCFSTYLWDTDFEELFTCLQVEGFEYNSLYCQIKYDWLKR